MPHSLEKVEIYFALRRTFEIWSHLGYLLSDYESNPGSKTGEPVQISHPFTALVEYGLKRNDTVKLLSLQHYPGCLFSYVNS